MNLIRELKRRNVIRMAGLYVVGAWLIVQVAGTQGTLATFEVACVDTVGAEQTVTQKQWSVQSPDGLVVVVDRWSFAQLGERLADAQWVPAEG